MPPMSKMAHRTSGRDGFATFMAHNTSGRAGHNILNHSGITCDMCNTANIKGVRFKCSVCADYDLCESCISANDSSKTHPHTFLRVPCYIDSNSPFTPAILRNRSDWVHEATCSVCRDQVVGFRFFCSSCAVDLCETCEQQGEHDVSHSLLKMPPPIQKNHHK